MKKTTLKIILYILSFPLASKAQLSSKIRQQYPAFVVSKVYEVTSKIDITEDTQLALANYFKKQDSLGTIALAKGEPIDKIMALYSFNPKNILSPVEWNDYLMINTGSNLKLRNALKFRKDLKLNKTQVDSLLLAIDELTKKLIIPNFDYLKYDGEHLAKILGSQKHKLFLALFYDSRALKSAKDDYQKAIKYNLIVKADSVKKVKELYNYELNKLVETDFVTQGEDFNKIDSVKKTIELNKPWILWKLNTLTARLPNTKLTEVVIYREAIGLSASQVDTFINKIIQLENIKYYERLNNPSSNFNQSAFETGSILKTLTNPQVESYLAVLNKRKAKYNTQQNWQKLKELSLVKDADSLAINQQHEAYELKYLIANQRFQMDKSQRNAFMRTAVQNQKPALLKQLDVLATDKAAVDNTKKQLSW